MNAHEDNPLKAALGGFMEQLVSSEELDPDRIIGIGRAHRRRHRVAASVGGAAAVLLVAGGVAYGLQGHGNALGSTGGPSASTRVSTPAQTRATPPPGTLKGAVVGRGITDGISWETSAALDGYANGNTLPQFCLYVWTSNGSTDPNLCEGPAQPDPADPVAPDLVTAGDQIGMLPKSTTLAFAAIYTAHVTTLEITYADTTLTLHPVTLASGVTVAGIVMPKTGASLTASGPTGHYSLMLSFPPA